MNLIYLSDYFFYPKAIPRYYLKISSKFVSSFNDILGFDESINYTLLVNSGPRKTWSVLLIEEAK